MRLKLTDWWLPLNIYIIYTTLKKIFKSEALIKFINLQFVLWTASLFIKKDAHGIGACNATKASLPFHFQPICIHTLNWSTVIQIWMNRFKGFYACFEEFLQDVYLHCHGDCIYRFQWTTSLLVSDIFSSLMACTNFEDDWRKKKWRQILSVALTVKKQWVKSNLRSCLFCHTLQTLECWGCVYTHHGLFTTTSCTELTAGHFFFTSDTWSTAGCCFSI